MSLLELLDAPGIHSTAQLAAELGTTPEMVEAKLERYAQLGYVKKTVMSADCGGNCKKCHGCSGLRSEKRGRKSRRQRDTGPGERNGETVPKACPASAGQSEWAGPHLCHRALPSAGPDPGGC